MPDTRGRLRRLARSARRVYQELDSPQRVWFTGPPAGPPHSPAHGANRRLSRRGPTE